MPTASVFVELEDRTQFGPYSVEFEMWADWTTRGHLDWRNPAGRTVTVASALVMAPNGNTRIALSGRVPAGGRAAIDLEIRNVPLDAADPETLASAYIAGAMATDEFVRAMDRL